jgi:hypothetical protein
MARPQLTASSGRCVPAQHTPTVSPLPSAVCLLEAFAPPIAAGCPLASSPTAPDPPSSALTTLRRESTSTTAPVRTTQLGLARG